MQYYFFYVEYPINNTARVTLLFMERNRVVHII